MGVAPEEIVNPPKKVLPCHSLLESANVVDEPAGSRWEAGFTFQPENCTEADAWNPCNSCQPGIVAISVCALTGTWEIVLGSTSTGPLAYNISAAGLQNALQAAGDIEEGPGQVVFGVSGGPGDADGSSNYIVTISGPVIDFYCETGVPPDWNPLQINNIDLAVGNCKTPLNGVVVQDPGVYREPKTTSANPEPVVYQPVILEVPYECSSFGFEATNYKQKAFDNIELAKGKALEYEFWTGSKNAENQSLVSGGADILNTGAPLAAVSPGIALVLLTQALSNCGVGARGMIHATPGLVQRWTQLGCVTQDEDGVLYTVARCDIVVAGSGYPGTGPDGQPAPGANEVWAYATGMVDVRMSEAMVIPDEFSQAFDRATNTVTFRGEVTAAATHDGCCLAAVLVDICGLN